MNFDKYYVKDVKNKSLRVLKHKKSDNYEGILSLYHYSTKS
jgi:hypothetical protein